MSTEHHAIHDERELMHEFDVHDEWFRHAADEPHHQDAHGRTNMWVITGFLLGTIFFVFGGSWLLVNIFFMTQIHSLKSQRQETVAPLSKLYESSLGGYAAGISQLRDSWNHTLATGAVTDPDKGLARVPLETAMRLVVDQYKEHAPE